MSRSILFLPVAALVLFAAIIGYRFGTQAQALDEGTVIAMWAERYVNERGAGARMGDCVGRPGRVPGVWIVVECRHADGAVLRYPVDRWGRLIRGGVPDALDT